MVSVVQGNGAIEAGGRQGRTTIYGVEASAPIVWNFTVAAGRFLPDGPPRAARSWFRPGLGLGGSWLFSLLVPALPSHTSGGYVLAAELLAVLMGVLAGVIPARRAAGLHPVEALRAE